MPDDGGGYDVDRFIARKPKNAKEFLQKKKVLKLRKKMSRMKKRGKRGY